MLRYEPILKNLFVRHLISLVLAMFSFVIVGVWDWFIGGAVLSYWSWSIFISDKYRHKYPQSYYSYLIASHIKANISWVILLLPVLFFSNHTGMTIFKVLVIFSILDIIPSVFKRRITKEIENIPIAAQNSDLVNDNLNFQTVSKRELLTKLKTYNDIKGYEELLELVNENIESAEGGTPSIDVVGSKAIEEKISLNKKIMMLIFSESSNQLKRLMKSLKYATDRVCLGGYFVFKYRPMEDVLAELKENKSSVKEKINYYWLILTKRLLPKIPILEQLYFTPPFSLIDKIIYPVTKKNRRFISRAEMWGRIYYNGFEVLDEKKVDNEYLVLSRKNKPEPQTKMPSFYLVVPLTKVGLNGELMQLHKMRSMYPFSEFIQEKIYEDQGLTKTGKFKEDFRLTGYGKFIRKYWLDEIPQIFDWLRGDIKLVGMRATSPQFLSLYPKELYELYIQIKPGLIPPIFDAKTDGFDDIVRIEMDYLKAYQKNPYLTDIKQFYKTFHDIFFRGVRSK